MKNSIMKKLTLGIAGGVLGVAMTMGSTVTSQAAGYDAALARLNALILAQQAALAGNTANITVPTMPVTPTLPVMPTTVTPGITAPAPAPAYNALLLVYSNQEGMGRLKECSVNGRKFNYSTECNIGDYVVAKVDVYELVSFDGWYINGERVSENKDFSFTVKEPNTVVEARMRTTGDYVGQHSRGIVTYNWANQTTRFAEGSGKYDWAVTTRLTGNGANVAGVCAPVIGAGRPVRTYNVTVTKNFGDVDITKFDSPQTFVFKIPNELKAPGRMFKMVHLYNGVATLCNDMDASDDTLTFSAIAPGSFALIQY